VEPSSISPFVWKLSAYRDVGCDHDVIRAMRFSNWASGQPDNAGDKATVREACVMMMSTGSQWDDVGCDQTACAICEYREDDDDDNNRNFEHH